MSAENIRARRVKGYGGCMGLTELRLCTAKGEGTDTWVDTVVDSGEQAGSAARVNPL